MNTWKMTFAISVVLAMAGCASGVPFNAEVTKEDFSNGQPMLVGNGVMQAGTICNKNPNGGSIITTSVAVNPKGVSALVQSEISTWVGNDDCQFKYDANGNMIPAGRIGQAFAQNADVKEKAITGFLGVVQSATQGWVAAEALPGCKGGSCGGAPIIVQANSQSGSASDVEINENTCPTGACSAPDE